MPRLSFFVSLAWKASSLALFITLTIYIIPCLAAVSIGFRSESDFSQCVFSGRHLLVVKQSGQQAVAWWKSGRYPASFQPAERASWPILVRRIPSKQANRRANRIVSTKGTHG